MKNIADVVYTYPTKHKEGFIQAEVEELLKQYPNINKDKFYSALDGNTCMLKGKEVIRYHCDIEKALVCGIEKRNLTKLEWD